MNRRNFILLQIILLLIVLTLSGVIAYLIFWSAR